MPVQNGLYIDALFASFICHFWTLFGIFYKAFPKVPENDASDERF